MLRHSRLVGVPRASQNAISEPGPANAPAVEPDRARASVASRAAIILFVVSLFLPTLYALGPLNLSPTLLYLAIAFVPLLACWAIGRAGGRHAIDWLVLGFAFWAAFTRFILLGTAAAIEPAGVVLLQTAGGYLAGRVLVRDIATTRLAFGAAIIGVLAMLPFLLFESATGAKPLLDIAEQAGDVEQRLGARCRFEQQEGQHREHADAALPVVRICNGRQAAARHRRPVRRDAPADAHGTALGIPARAGGV